jgi:tetratricopeptide (TPR) repeat protein
MNQAHCSTLGFVVMVAAILTAPPRDAAARSDALEKGRKLYDDLEYEKAIPALKTAAVDAAASKAEIVEAFELLGYATVAAGREAEALEAFIKLLKVDRTFKLKPRTSPKIRAIFDRAQSLVPDEVDAAPPPKLRHVHIPTSRPGEPVRIDVTVTDAAHRVRSVTLRHRSAVRGAFQSLPMNETGVGRFSITVNLTPGHDAIDYYFLARDERGITVAALRDEESPYRVLTRTTKPVAKAESSLLKKWWFWLAVGGAASLSATIAIVASGTAGTSMPDYGNVRLVVK